MNSSTKASLIGLIGGAIVAFLASAIIQFRLLPALQADTVRIGRAAAEMPTDQFVAWAAPMFFALGCFAIVLASIRVVLARNVSLEPPADRSATQTAQPAANVGSRTDTLGWTVLIAAVVVAAVLAFIAYPTEPRHQWMTSAQYQREFDTRAQKGFYPHEVEGECQSDGEKFRADWRAIPSGASFLAHHGMTRQDYDRRNHEYPTKGYALGSVNQFKDCSGIDRYQATWLKR